MRHGRTINGSRFHLGLLSLTAVAIAACLATGPGAVASAQGTPGDLPPPAPATTPATGPATAASTEPSTAPSDAPLGAELATQPAAVPATQPDAQDSAAVEALMHSAKSLSTSARFGRADRLIALTAMAYRLDPSNCQVNWMLGNIYQSQLRLVDASRRFNVCVTASPDEFAQALQWIDTTRRALQTAEGQIAFLQGVMARKDLAGYIRAEAAAQEALILYGNYDRAGAAKAVEQSLQLDSRQLTALNLKLSSATQPAERATIMVDMLQGAPSYDSAAWSLGNLLSSVGMYDEAMAFFEYAWQVRQFRRNDLTTIESQMFVTDYFNVMIDAAAWGNDPKLAARAIEIFQPMLKHYTRSVDLRTLLVEAYRMAGQAEQANKLVTEMSDYYVARAKEQAADSSAPLAAEMAWFYLVTKPDAQQALLFARKAVELNSVNPGYQRILGAAELASSQASLKTAGLGRLKDMLDRDVYAAVLLAIHTDATAGDDQEAVQLKAKAMAAALDFGRSGPAFRRLMAALPSVRKDLKDAAARQQVAKAMDAFDRQTLAMILTPEKFVSVTFKAPESVITGQKLPIEATLTNLSGRDIPLGTQGMINPVVRFTAVVMRDGKEQARFSELPMAVWPAPKYLAAGKSLTTTVRLDSGDLAAYLDASPLDEFVLRIEPMIDPIEQITPTREVRGGLKRDFASGLPTLKVEPLTIARRTLLSAAKARPDNAPMTASDAYKSMLGVIAQDQIIRGQLDDKLRSAVQVGSLLTLARRVEQNRGSLPEGVSKVFDKWQLVSMLQALLKDESPLVRSAAIVSMGDVTLDGFTKSPLPVTGNFYDKLFKPLTTDPHPLVRLRMAELLAVSGIKDAQALLKDFSNDKDPLIAQLATEFLTLINRETKPEERP